jgi:hypothetical protein
MDMDVRIWNKVCGKDSVEVGVGVILRVSGSVSVSVSSEEVLLLNFIDFIFFIFF